MKRYDPVEYYSQGGSGRGHMEEDKHGDYYLADDVDEIIKSMHEKLLLLKDQIIATHTDSITE